LTAVLQPAGRTLYRVRRSTLAGHSFPSLRRFLTRRPCLLDTAGYSAAPKRTFRSALVSAGWRAQRENDRRKERGIWAEHSKRIESGTGQRRDNERIVRCIVYDARPSPSTHFLPSAASSPVAPACWPRGKIPPHPSARSARHSSPQDGGPKGKMIEGRSGGSGRSTRSESWAPPEKVG